MNQILIGKNNVLFHEDDDSFKNKKKYKPIITLSISIICFFVLIMYYIYSKYNINKQNKFSEKLTDSFEISRLYATTSKTNSNEDSENNFSTTNNSNFDIIGIIEIKKLGIHYPILSNCSEEYLKIAPCRIAGPLPNAPGNLCIAAHNYNNSTFFSNINTLKISDIITIYDSYGNSVDYKVYKNEQISSDDLSTLSQENLNYREISLFTCNNSDSNKRFMIKAKEM